MSPEKAKRLLEKTFEVELQTVESLEEINAPEWIIREAKGVGFYTKRSRTGDTHNLSHGLMLRLDAHAQKEIRDLAGKIAEAYKLHTPASYEAFENYILNGMRLSEKEIELIKKNRMLTEIDLENLDTYKGVGFIIPVDKDDPSKGKTLSREGQLFKKKLILLKS